MWSLKTTITLWQNMATQNYHNSLSQNMATQKYQNPKTILRMTAILVDAHHIVSATTNSSYKAKTDGVYCTSGAPLKPLRDDSALRGLSTLRGLRGAPEVPPL